MNPSPGTGEPVRPVVKFDSNEDEEVVMDSGVLAVAAGQEEACEDREEWVNKPEFAIPRPEPDDFDEHGVRVPFHRRPPKAPTAQEKLNHDLIHIPFRSWCPHCVAGAAKASPHMKATVEEERSVPGYHGDY